MGSVTSLAIGWETPQKLCNNGAVMAVPVLNKISLKGLQISCSFMFTTPAFGAANVLFTAARMTAAQWPHWQMPNDTQDYVALPNNPDFAAPGFAGVPAGGGAGGKGQFCAMVLKSNPLTTGGNTPAQSASLFIPLFNMDLDPLDGVFCHMDHMGRANEFCDAEMQATLLYAPL